jgi:hypothetical protein
MTIIRLINAVKTFVGQVTCDQNNRRRSAESKNGAKENEARILVLTVF